MRPFHGGAERASDQPLNLLGTAVDPALGTVALFSRMRGVGEHGILRRDPSANNVLFFHPTRDGFLDGDATDDPSIAPFDEGGAGGVRGDVVLEADGTKLIWSAAVGAGGVVTAHGGRS